MYPTIFISQNKRSINIRIFVSMPNRKVRRKWWQLCCVGTFFLHSIQFVCHFYISHSFCFLFFSLLQPTVFVWWLQSNNKESNAYVIAYDGSRTPFFFFFILQIKGVTCENKNQRKILKISYYYVVLKGFSWKSANFCEIFKGIWFQRCLCMSFFLFHLRLP